MPVAGKVLSGYFIARAEKARTGRALGIVATVGNHFL